MKELTLKPQTLADFIRSLSGCFITKSNPHGITPKEVIVISLLYTLAGDKEISNAVKEQISKELNQVLQVTVNYINKLKKKRVIVNNKLNPIFFKQAVTISYGN